MTIENIVNLRLLSHPVNWLVVWTVLLFAVMAHTLAHEYFAPVSVE